LLLFVGGENKEPGLKSNVRCSWNKQETLMNEKLTWDDAEEIGIQLFEKLPDTDPLSVRFSDLHRWVCDLDDFDDDPEASTERKLESIQMAWLEEWQDANG